MRGEQVPVQSMNSSLIQVKGLRKTYRIGDQVVHALDGLDLAIDRNEYVALMGPSGSGKSTLMTAQNEIIGIIR